MEWCKIVLLVDDQSGSKDLFPYIKAIEPNAVLTRIDPPFGDMVWHGNGPDGSDIRVAVEYKKLDDVLRCMVDGRFVGHQLMGLIEHFPLPMGRIYLLIEMGMVRVDRNSGVLQKRHGDRWYDINRAGRGFMARDIEHWITTVEEQAQIRVHQTFDEFESARWIKYKYTWYTAKGWDEHKSLQQFHVPPPPAAYLIKPGFVRRVVKEFPDVGWDRSDPVARHFGNVYRAVNADADEWAGIVVGKNSLGHVLTVGKNRAKVIVNKIRGIGGDK